MYYIEETADWTDSKHCLTSSPRIPIAPDPHDTRTKSCDAGNRDFRVVSPARAGKERETQRRYIQHLSDEQMEGGEKEERSLLSLLEKELNSLLERDCIADKNQRSFDESTCAFEYRYESRRLKEC